MSDLYNKHYKLAKHRLLIMLCLSLLVSIGCFSKNSLADEGAELNNEMSMSSIILFALDNNPDIEMAKAMEKQIYYGIGEAKSAYYPQVKFNGEFGREFNDPTGGSLTPKGKATNSNKAKISVNQLLFDGFSSTQEIKSQESSHFSAILKTRTDVEKIITEAIKNYLNVFLYQNGLIEVMAYRDNIKEIADVVTKTYEAGGANKAYQQYALARMAMVDSELADAKSSLNDAISNIEFLTGPLPEFKAIAPEMLNPDDLDLTFYLDYVEENNSDILLNAAAKDAVKHKIQSEKGLYLPRLGLYVDTEVQNDNGGKVGMKRTAKALFTISYNMFDGFSRDSTVKKLKSKYNELSIKDRKIIKELKKNVKLFYNQINYLKENLKATDLEIEANKSLREINNTNFKHGEISVIDLVDGEEKLKNSKIRKYQLKTELYYNVYNLLILSGILNQMYFCESCENL